MEIIAIFPPYIYSIQYDGSENNEFDRLLNEWNDVAQVTDFFTANKDYLKTSVWEYLSEPENAARQVLDEAASLEMLFEQLYELTQKGDKPDYDSHFHYLDGKYKFEMEYVPMKSYGVNSPSLLRMYAIKMGENTYLITGGGIKLGAKIQDSPGLKDHVIQNIDSVRDWLKLNGILDSDDMENS